MSHQAMKRQGLKRTLLSERIQSVNAPHRLIPAVWKGPNYGDGEKTSGRQGGGWTGRDDGLEHGGVGGSESACTMPHRRVPVATRL